MKKLKIITNFLVFVIFLPLIILYEWLSFFFGNSYYQSIISITLDGLEGIYNYILVYFLHKPRESLVDCSMFRSKLDSFMYSTYCLLPYSLTTYIKELFYNTKISFRKIRILLGNDRGEIYITHNGINKYQIKYEYVTTETSKKIRIENEDYLSDKRVVNRNELVTILKEIKES